MLVATPMAHPVSMLAVLLVPPLWPSSRTLEVVSRPQRCSTVAPPIRLITLNVPAHTHTPHTQSYDERMDANEYYTSNLMLCTAFAYIIKNKVL